MAEATSKLEATFASALEELTPNQTLGIAVSGGGDSMALLALARDWAATAGITLTVATVDHGLRPESPDEAAFVGQICADWEIPHQILELSGLDRAGNLPAMARNARYDALSAWAVSSGAETVLLGHTMDDQAETLLMRLARGSGVEGLSGMADRMTWNRVQFLRPLLSIRRNTLRTWLCQHAISWVDDPTNDDDRYDRVKAREALALLDPLGVTVEGLSETANRLSRQRKVLETAADELSAAHVTYAEHSASLRRDAFRDAVPDTAMRVLASVLQRIGGKQYRPRFRALEPLYQRIVSQEQTTITLSHCLIRLQRDEVQIELEHPDAAHPSALQST